MKKFIGKRDMIVILSVILLSILIFLIFKFTGERGDKVIVTVDNKVVESFSLSENKEYYIENDYGRNVLIIENGYAYIKEADCPDEICVKTGKICKRNEIIVCLPHKLVISIEAYK